MSRSLEAKRRRNRHNNKRWRRNRKLRRAREQALALEHRVQVWQPAVDGALSPLEAELLEHRDAQLELLKEITDGEDSQGNR